MEDIDALIAKYRSKGLLVDTNLLLLYLIGCYNPDQITSFKRTKSFTVEDFELLQLLLDQFDVIVTTPNILTEVSNLSNQLPETVRLDYYSEFSRRLLQFDEHYLGTKVICRLPDFNRFGLTDTGIIELVKDRFLVLTDDFRLSGCLQSRSSDAINFNHIRAWFGEL